MRKMVEGDENQAFSRALLLKESSFKKKKNRMLLSPHFFDFKTLELKMQINRNLLGAFASLVHLFVMQTYV